MDISNTEIDIEVKEEPSIITFYKTLVIGLGGTGREVCQLLKSILYKESHGDLKKYNHVKFLSIDTRERETPVDPQIFGLPSVDFDGDEEMTLTVVPNIDTNKYSWFDEGQTPMLRNLKGEGAGARRQIGRLILLENWSKVFDKVRFKIQDLQNAQYDSEFKKEWAGRVECKAEVSIYIVGNLVSGTGSGMMLEMGYLINSIRDNYADVVNRSIAITTMTNKKYQDMGRRMINTTAALRELNHFYHEEIYGNSATCFKIEAPTAPPKITHKKLLRPAPPYDRILLIDLDSFDSAPMEPEQSHYLISRFLYHQTGTHVGAHFRGKDVDDAGCTELDMEGNPLVCKSFGVMSVTDQKTTIDRRCAFQLAERIIRCISGEDNITIERLLIEGFNLRSPSRKNDSIKDIKDHAKNFARELTKVMKESLDVQFEKIKGTIEGVTTGIGVKYEEYIENLVKQTYTFLPKLSVKEFPIVLEGKRKYLEQQFDEIKNQIQNRAYMMNSDGTLKSLFDFIWEKIEDKISAISNVISPQEGNFTGNLHSAERFLYFLAHERDNLLKKQFHVISTNEVKYKAESESSLTQFNNAETRMKDLYKQYFGKPVLKQAVLESKELAKDYYLSCLKHVIWKRCSLIFTGDNTQSKKEEKYRKGILILAKKLSQKYKEAYKKICTISNRFYQDYLNEHPMSGGVGMVTLPAETDEKTIYEESLKNPERIINLIKRVLDDYANGLPQELGNIDDEKEQKMHSDLFQWCMDYVNEIAVRPSFNDIFDKETDFKEALKEYLNRALPMIKFDVNRVNLTGIQDRPGYCAIAIPKNSEALQEYIKNHDSFKTVRPVFLERVDKIYNVDIIIASHPYNPSVSQRVQELCGFYNQVKNLKDLHLFPEYILLPLAGTDEQTQACYDLAMAMEWLKIDWVERTLKYYYTYESEYTDEIELSDISIERNIEIYTWKDRTNPIYDQLWRSIALFPRDPDILSSITVLRDILIRIRREIERDREAFIKTLKDGVLKLLQGKTSLLYKDMKLGSERPLFKAFAELIARVIGKNPVDVDSWLKKKGHKKAKERYKKPQRAPMRRKAMACYDLGMAMKWLKIDEREHVLEYSYEYREESGLGKDKKFQGKTIEIYNWEDKKKPDFYHLWELIATEPIFGNETLLNSILNRVEKEVETDRDGFFQHLKKGQIKIIKGDVKLLYKKIDSGQERQLEKKFADFISGAIGEKPGVVEDWIKHALPVNLDELENEARSSIASKDYLQARAKFEEIIKWAPERKQTIENEFGFLYNFENSADKDKEQWNENKELINQWQSLWYNLSENNTFTLNVRTHKGITPTLEEEEKLETPQEVTIEKIIDEETTKKADEFQVPPQEKGEEFENAVIALFRQFFIIAMDLEETLLLNLRKQKKGLQFGHDISFECVSKENEKVSCKIECKDMKANITDRDIAHKLLAVEASDQKIDHWILISAHSDPTDYLKELLAAWKEIERFPFEIHIWSPESGIMEFFGLKPEIYIKFYGEKKIDGIHPKQWTESKRRNVFETWKERLSLKPLSRIPKEWKKYLREPKHMLLKEEKERGKELEMLYNNPVELRCKDKSNALLKGTMEDHVRQWLQENEKDVMFILGEFGDGKTTFTYILARRLAREFLEDPIDGWIPIRLSLNDYQVEIKSQAFPEMRFAEKPQAFLERRLSEFSANLASWNELRQEKNIFIILDGFDEMSLKLDPETIRKNIKDLTDIYKEFKGMKILVTSRTHFFENKQDEKLLLQRLGKPPVFYLAPIERNKRIEYLEKTDSSPERKELLRILCKLHDPLDLASKPLFLQMIETTLNKLQKGKITEETLNEINEIKLYNDYIDESFNRKRDQWDTFDNVDLEKAGLNIFQILEQLAIKLQESNLSYVSLEEFSRDFSYKCRKQINDFIWEISGTTEEDAAARVQVRSLLARVVTAEDSCKRPVKFCHRSMREFFVARGIQRALKEDKKQALELLTNLQLNHEILHFSAELMKNDAPENYEKNLVDITKSSEISSRRGGPGGNAITLLYRLKGTLPENNWSGLNLDGANLSGADLSGMEFIDASLRYANLDNVILENADLSGSDLKGVRLEETPPVLAVTSEPMGNRIFAAYRDNTIWEWENILKREKVESRVIFENTKGAITWLGILHGSDLCAMTNEELIFYDCENGEQLIEKSRFRIKPQYRQAIAKKNILTILSETEINTNKALLVDLGEMEITNSLEFEKASLCENLDFKAIVITDGKSSIRIEGLEAAQDADPLILPAHDITSLCVHTCNKDEQYLLACGQRNGELQVWQIDYVNDKWQEKLLLKNHVHEGIVSSLCFLDDTRIVSGGIDRKISILKFGEEEGLQGSKEQDLCLTLRCKGLKIDGVQGPREKEMLEKLIKKAEIQ